MNLKDITADYLINNIPADVLNNLFEKHMNNMYIVVDFFDKNELYTRIFDAKSMDELYMKILDDEHFRHIAYTDYRRNIDYDILDEEYINNELDKNKLIDILKNTGVEWICIRKLNKFCNGHKFNYHS